MGKYPKHKYELTQFSADEGGGWMITFPDLPGCIADGETMGEAIQNGAEAEEAWLASDRSPGDVSYPDPDIFIRGFKL